ncbi:MAG: nucleotidyltransferase family protein [Phycisphaerales bacterium]
MQADPIISSRLKPEQFEAVKAFCAKYGVAEFALFGSILRDDFRPESDVDVSLRFKPGFGIDFDNRPDIFDDLRAIFGREVDIVEPRLLKNPFRRREILSTMRVLHAA